jgi:hypothetical protein
VRNTFCSLILASFVGVSALAAAAASTAGCGGGGGGSGGSGGSEAPICYDYSKFDGTKPEVSFKTDVLPILQRSCGLSANCHGDAGKPFEDRPYLGPNKEVTATAVDIEQIITGLVGVSAYYEPSMSIVAEGDPEHSFMMYKLDFALECDKLKCAEGKDCGTNMPQGNKDPLALDERDLIRRWIAQGAQNN